MNGGTNSSGMVHAEEALRPFNVLDKKGNIRTGTQIILSTRPNADLWVEGVQQIVQTPSCSNI